MQDQRIEPVRVIVVLPKAHSAAGRGLLPRLAVAMMLWLTVLSVSFAAENRGPVEIHAEGAPLSRTLQALLGDGRVDVRVDEDIDDLLSGRLVGTIDEIVALLVDTHELDMYQQGNTVWFDRSGRPVVDFVRLDERGLLDALRELASPVMPGGTVVVEADSRGLVLTGSRAYVESSLARIALATGNFASDFNGGKAGRALPSLTNPANENYPLAPAPGEPDIGSAAPLGPVAALTPLLGKSTGRQGGHSLGSRRSGVALPLPSDAATARAPVLPLDQARTQKVLGARIVLVSSTAPKTIILEDGRNVTTGGTLPNGHRILTIERNRIVLERDGSPIIVAMP